MNFLTRLAQTILVTGFVILILVGISNGLNNDFDKHTELDKIALELFPPEELPIINCTSVDYNIGINDPSYRLQIKCIADSWGRWDVFYVSEAELDFKESVLYNDSLGVVFMTNPVELYVVFYDDAGKKADIWLQIDSALRSCVPENSCYIP